ncbi:hypothetical protein GQ457_06G019540 [Hibiscus cannabinus]
MVSEIVSLGSVPEPLSAVVGSNSSKPFTNKSISIRLDETNYLMWRQQVLFAIDSLALGSHIDGTAVVPPQHVVVNGVRALNPEFVVFKQEDSVLCSWLLSSISGSILPSLVNCRTVIEIWDKVQQNFSVLSTTKIILAACGNPLTEIMHISTILSGLPLEYELVVAVITSSQQPYKLDGVCSVLLDTEARQQKSYDGFYSANFVEEAVDVHGLNTESVATQDLSGTVALVSGDFSHVVCEDASWFPDSGATAHLTPKDNNISVEFFPDSCVVKDLQTPRVMLQGVESSGLYKLSSSSLLQQSSDSGPCVSECFNVEGDEPSSIAPVGDELQSSPMVAEFPLPYGCVSQPVVLSPTDARSSIVSSQSVAPGPMVPSRSVQEPIVYRRKSKSLCGQQQHMIESSTAQSVPSHCSTPRPVSYSFSTAQPVQNHSSGVASSSIQKELVCQDDVSVDPVPFSVVPSNSSSSASTSSSVSISDQSPNGA